MRYTEFEEDILDQETGLVWKKYPEKGMYTFEEALALENSEWRLPTIKELFSIVDHGLENPATSLPNHTSLAFWSGSLNVCDSDYAWYVSFSVGVASYNFRGVGRGVRLVRR